MKNNIVNAERRGKRQVLIRPSSKVVVKFLSVMQRHGEPRISNIMSAHLHLGVITTIAVLLPPHISRFNAPKYKRLVPHNQKTCLFITHRDEFTAETTFTIHCLWPRLNHADTTRQVTLANLRSSMIIVQARL